jgi:hypothetical protein
VPELPPIPDQPSGPSVGQATPADGTKVCPRCAETVQAAASACRFCGLDFRSGTVPMPAVPAPVPTTNGLAVASMVLGIVWVYWIGSILAIIFGYQAKKQIDASGGRESGRGMAVAGIVLGWVGVGGLILFIVIGLAVRVQCVGLGC